MNGVATGLSIVLSAAALYGLQHTTPYYGEITSPIAVAGRTGERVDANAFALAIGDIHLARMVRTESFGRVRTYTTSGLWVLVEAAAEAKSESLTLTSAEWLGPNGVRYALSERFSTVAGLLPSERLDPGLPKPVLMAFEIPESQAFGGTLLISRSAYMPLDEEARIAVTGIKPDGIRNAITIFRNNGEMPWTLRAE